MSGSGPYRESKPTGFDVESWFRKPGVQINPAGGHRFDLGMFDAQVDAMMRQLADPSRFVGLMQARLAESAGGSLDAPATFAAGPPAYAPSYSWTRPPGAFAPNECAAYAGSAGRGAARNG